MLEHRRAQMRWIAALLLPLLVMSGTVVAYRLFECGHRGPISLAACCDSDPAERLPVLQRACCQSRIVQVEQLPGSEARHAAQGPALPSQAPIAEAPVPPVLVPSGHAAQLAAAPPERPPVILITRALLI